MLVPQMVCILVLFLPGGGVLTVETEPGAQVAWEGVVLGRADERGRMEIQDIPLGSYSLTVSKKGFSPLQKRIEVHAGLQVAGFRLSPLRPAASPPAARAQPEAVPLAAEVSTNKAGAASTAAWESLLAEADAVEVRRSSQIDLNQSSEVPRFWYFLVALVMAGVLFRFLRRPSGTVPPPRPERPAFRGPGPDSRERRPNSEPAEAPEPGPAGSSAAFLDDLRRREAMAEKGVVVLSRDEEEAAIELDKAAVRIVDEE